MASFVERATLIVSDQSSGQIKGINKALGDLFKTASKLRNLKVDIRGLDRADSMVRRLTRDMQTLGSKTTRINVTANTGQAQSAINRLRVNAGKPISIPVQATGLRNLNGPVPTNQRGPRGGNNRFGVGGGIGGLGVGFGSSSLLQAATAGAAFAAARTAGRATLDRQAEQTTQRVLGLTVQQMEELNRVSRKASAGILNVTETQAQAATRNLMNAGATGSALEELSRAAAQSEAALTSQFGAADAKRITEQAIKAVDLAGAIDDPARGKELIKAITAAQITQGQDFNMASFLAALRTTTSATSLTADAMVEFAAAVDEQGQRAGSSLERFNKVLTAADRPGSGVASGTIALLEKSGLRDAARRDRALLENDPFAFIDKNVIPKLQELGVALDDTAAVKKSLQELGFVGQDLRFAQQAVIKKDERARNRARNRQVRMENFEALARRDLGLAMQGLKAQFQDVSATALEPFARGLADVIVDVSKGLDEIGQGQLTAKGVKAALTAGALGAVAFAVEHPGAVALTLAGGRLTGSAGALNRAAAALSRAAAADGAVPGAGVPGKGRGRLRRFTAGVGGGVAGAAVMGATELLSGGDVKEAAGVAAGAFVGGVVGSLGGPAGTLIGSFIGGEMGRSLGPAIEETVGPLLKKLQEDFRKDPLVRAFGEEGREFFATVRQNQRDRDITTTERKRRDVMQQLDRDSKQREFTLIAQRVNFFGEDTKASKTGSIPTPTPKPMQGIMEELEKSKPIKLEIIAEPEVTSMIRMLQLERREGALTRQDSIMRTKDEGLSPVTGNVFNQMLQGMDNFSATFKSDADIAAASFESTFLNGAVQMKGAGTSAADAIRASGDGLAAAGTQFGANAAAAFNANARIVTAAAAPPAAPVNTGNLRHHVE